MANPSPLLSWCWLHWCRACRAALEKARHSPTCFHAFLQEAMANYHDQVEELLTGARRHSCAWREGHELWGQWRSVTVVTDRVPTADYAIPGIGFLPRTDLFDSELDMLLTVLSRLTAPCAPAGGVLQLVTLLIIFNVTGKEDYIPLATNAVRLRGPNVAESRL